MNRDVIRENTKGISLNFRFDERGPYVAIFHKRFTWYAMLPIDDKMDIEFCEFIKKTNEKIDRLTEDQITTLRRIGKTSIPFSLILDTLVKSQ